MQTDEEIGIFKFGLFNLFLWASFLFALAHVYMSFLRLVSSSSVKKVRTFFCKETCQAILKLQILHYKTNGKKHSFCNGIN